MRTVLVLLAAACALAGARNLSAEALRSPAAEDIDAVFSAFAGKQLPGCAVGIARGDALLHARGYGLANLEHNVPLSADSVFRSGSVSKQFTATAIALLAERGALSLDDTLGRHLPELHVSVHPVTVRQTLAHLGGLPDYDALEDPALLTDASGNPFTFGAEDHLTIEEFFTATTKVKASHPPGSKFSYSNIGYFWLGQIVERVSGQSLAAFAREHVFVPAGMHHSFFNDRVSQLVPNRASGYRPAGTRFENFETNLDWVGDGGVYTSINDFARWNQQFREPTLGKDPQALRQRLTEPLLAPKQAGKNAEGYGFGLNIGSDEAGRRYFAHSGSWVAFRTGFKRYPDLDFAYWLLCNRPDADTTALGQAIEALYLSPSPTSATAPPPAERSVTLLFTNDLESAYEPVTANWRDDLEHIGGLPQLATLIDQERERAETAFLLDAGDIFTGSLAAATEGEIAFELMLTMGYDAMAIGNHEFEYGSERFAEQKERAPFPVLGTNLFYRDSGRPYAQRYAILERNGIRLAVFGILGQDAANALIPANIAALEVRDPATVLRPLIDEVQDQVDLIVVLTHQGPTAPMQTNDAGDPTVYRGNRENLALAGAVPGIDVILAGHTDAGTRAPLVHPDTGTLIMQTFGQGQHLGRLTIVLNEHDERVNFSGELITVNSDALKPHSAVVAKIHRYREAEPALKEIIGRTEAPLSRRYCAEAPLGSLFADILRERLSTPIALMPSGALRRDLPAGDISREVLLDAFPFSDRMARVTLSGRLLREVLEQGLSMERGLLQVSGLTVAWDPSAPPGKRLETVTVGDEPLEDDAAYLVGTLEIIATGGDAYEQFRRSTTVDLEQGRFADALTDYFVNNSPISAPDAGRFQAVQGKTLTGC